MTTVPDPLTRVLEVAGEDDVDQPAPPAEVRSWSGEIAPVTEPCELCGCHWICNPDAFLPKGHAECCYCRTWRGSIHRDAKLSEFSKEPEAASEDATCSETDGETMEILLSGGMPVYDPEPLDGQGESAVGVVDYLKEGESA